MTPRISGDRISAALFRAFTTYGASVYDCGLASTPSMFMAVLELPCDCSVQITASHHPFFRNGLKFFTPAGGLDSPDISEILEYAERRCAEGTDNGTLVPVDYMSKYADNLRG